MVHGAFRGGWSFAAVIRELSQRGHSCLAPSLRGMGEWTVPPGTTLSLFDWVEDLGRLVDLHDTRDLVAVGHSLGGVVITALAAQHPERITGLVYLDSPVPQPGDRAVDLSGGGRPAIEDLPPESTWIAPTPLGHETGLDDRVRGWINDRLCSTPVGPSLDVIFEHDLAVPVRYAFCRATPAGFPSAISRQRLDDAGVPYELLDAPHDVVITHPELVADLLVDAANAFSR